MFITDGQSPTVNTTNLFEMIDQNQEKLGRTILHNNINNYTTK
jgi:hypothetical protein